MKKRMLGIILAVCLIFSVLPFGASAQSAESILNSAKLKPDYFLRNEAMFYDEIYDLIGITHEDEEAVLLDVINKCTNSRMSTYQKVKALYDYIIDNTSYGLGEYFVSSIYNVLVGHVGVCDDYNYVMMAFLRYLGIDAATVGGQTTKAGGGYTGHAWCEAYINGKTYIFDPQIEDNIAKGGPVYYYRFCKTYDEVAGCYIMDTENIYLRVFLMSPYTETVVAGDFPYGTTLKNSGIGELDLEEFELSVPDASFTGFYYNQACTDPADMNAPMHHDMFIWAGAGVPPFVDVQLSASYAGAVEWAVGNGIVAGKDATHFAPQSACTRGQVVTFLWRAAGRPEPVTSENPFSDVKESSPYYKAILWAAENKIAAGFSDGCFKPNNTVTRAQFVTFLWRFNGSPAPESARNPFVDVKDSSPFCKAIMWAAENGITSGYGNNDFRPNNTCSRWHVVAFLYRNLVKS